MYLIFVLQHQNPYFLSSPLYPYLQRFHSRIRRPPSRGSRPRLFGLVKQYNSRGSQCLGLWQFHWWQLHCQLLLSFDPQHWGFEYHWQSQCQHLFGHVIHQGGEPRVLISPTRTQTILRTQKFYLSQESFMYIERPTYQNWTQKNSGDLEANSSSWKIKEGLDYSIIKTKLTTQNTFTWPYSYCQIPTWTLLFYFCFVDSHSWFLCPFFVVFIWDFKIWLNLQLGLLIVIIPKLS